MPRPRVILAVGAGDEASPLPEPDISVNLDQVALEAGVEELRGAFTAGAFAADAPAFEPEELQTGEGNDEESDHHEHGHMEHEGEEHGSSDEGEEDQGEHEGRGDHGGEGFMSMIEMTKDLPRSSDGLQMEWVQAPFGPLFPGLPGGLALMFTLDGDTVAGAEAASELGGRERLTGSIEGFADRMARLDPHAPVAYRLLARKAFEDAAGASADERAARAGGCSGA